MTPEVASTTQITLNLSWILGAAGVALLVQIVVAIGTGLITASRVAAVFEERFKAMGETLRGHAARLDDLDERLAAATQDSMVYDSQIRERLGKDYVPRDDCRQMRAEDRETRTRLFAKIEVVQLTLGRIEGRLQGAARESEETPS